MGVPTSIFVNPYLLAIWKKTWSYSKRADFSENLTPDDLDEIHCLSGIGDEYLGKLLGSEHRIKRVKISTLDKLCFALNSINNNFQSTWQNFEFAHRNNKIFKDCDSLKNKKKDSIIDDLQLREIRKYSRIKVQQVFEENIHNSNLPLINPLIESDGVLKKA
jgi:hypothetical protein